MYFYVGMDNISPIELTLYFNMQKYPPGGGYKVFHCERAGNQFFPIPIAYQEERGAPPIEVGIKMKEVIDKLDNLMSTKHFIEPNG